MSKTLRPVLLFTGTLGAVYLLVYLSYPEFFTWNPANSANLVFGWLQYISSFAWFSAALGPLAFWISGSEFSQRKSLAYLVSALFWPAALVALHIYLFFSSGNAGLAYLVNYPIFVLTDIIFPVIYVQLWRTFATKRKPKGLIKNDFVFDSTSSD